MITFACVWTGSKYGYHHVAKLRNMIHRNTKGLRYRLVCFHDQTKETLSQADGSIDFMDIRELGLTGWWAKMALFEPSYRGKGRTIYFDLDTVIVDTIRPLTDLEVPFGICANFTRRSGVPQYPCGYGSCVMTFEQGFGGDIWDSFRRAQDTWIKDAGAYGDQWVIGKLHPNAVLLQDALPRNFFIGRREFSEQIPQGASVMIFAGKVKPDNSNLAWVKEHWK